MMKSTQGKSQMTPNRGWKQNNHKQKIRNPSDGIWDQQQDSLEHQAELWKESQYFHSHQCLPSYFLKMFSRICLLHFFLRQICSHVSIIFLIYIWFYFLFILSFDSFFFIHLTFYFTLYFIYVHFIINNETLKALNHPLNPLIGHTPAKNAGHQCCSF